MVSVADTLAPSAQAPRKNAAYLELREILRQRGLLEPQVGDFIRRLLRTFGLLALALTSIVLVGDSWWQLVNAVLFAFVSTQVGLLGHDVGHRQTIRAGRLADLLGLLCGNLLIGISNEWWIDKHNRHHSHSNEAGNDPDIDIPLLAFSPEEASEKRGFIRLCVRHQHWILFPIMTVLAFVWRPQSVQFLLSNQARRPTREMVLLLAHLALYAVFVFWVMNPLLAVAFILTHQMLFGLYMGSIFAPNHKGMPLWAADAPPDFLLQQVVTSRNVIGGRLTDFWYGGLNYQIEHHLFPTLARGRLSAVQPIVRAFCEARGISYHETSLFQSYREITASMREIAETLRPARSPA